MLNEKTLLELKNLKTQEEIVIGEYKIIVRALNIREVLNYAEEMSQFIRLKKEGVDMVKIFTDIGDLVNRTTNVFHKEEKIEYNDLPLPIAMHVIEVWAELNFIQKEMIIQPIERALSKILNKPINLTAILENLSVLLSSMGTPIEKTSGNLRLEN